MLILIQEYIIIMVTFRTFGEKNPKETPSSRDLKIQGKDSLKSVQSLENRQMLGKIAC